MKIIGLLFLIAIFQACHDPSNSNVDLGEIHGEIAYKGKVTLQTKIDYQLNNDLQFIVDQVYIKNDSVYLFNEFGGSGKYFFELIAVPDSIEECTFNLYPIIESVSIDNPSADLGVYSIYDLCELKKNHTNHCDSLSINVFQSDWHKIAAKLKL